MIKIVQVCPLLKHKIVERSHFELFKIEWKCCDTLSVRSFFKTNSAVTSA